MKVRNKLTEAVLREAEECQCSYYDCGHSKNHTSCPNPATDEVTYAEDGSRIPCCSSCAETMRKDDFYDAYTESKLREKSWYHRNPSGKCECGDTSCPVHKGSEHCSGKATQTLYRVDMDDETGTAFCDGCAADAFDSGVFKGEGR